MFGFVSLVISFFIFFTMLYIKYVLGRSFILTPLPILATTFFIMAVNFLLIGILAQLNTPKKYKSTISVKEIRDL